MSEGGVTGKQEKAQECQLFPTTNVARGCDIGNGRRGWKDVQFALHLRRISFDQTFLF